MPPPPLSSNAACPGSISGITLTCIYDICADSELDPDEESATIGIGLSLESGFADLSSTGDFEEYSLPEAEVEREKIESVSQPLTTRRGPGKGSEPESDDSDITSSGYLPSVSEFVIISATEGGVFRDRDVTEEDVRAAGESSPPEKRRSNNRSSTGSSKKED
ncbi:hypothetical protein C8R41DRAFT_606051 [Lentinula lateritia]|uniref:Uncharacterized protein n=1 Tax=Lentinula lateritia TaxID=40482 RepID=A0ABQ8VTN4_9AGAR|nr:hypothetical protein C8R41DRAFT_606051 [Lentinula lateritia]